MRKFKEKNINSFFYFFYIMILTALYLGLYNFFSFRKEINPGFGKAIAINNNNDICIVSRINIECQKNLFKKIDNNNTNILFLGNSQTGAINHYQEGDESFITYLNKKSMSSKISIQAKGIWLPNANLREFEIIYKSLKNCFIDPEILFLPVFLDDLRRDSIRKELDSYEYYLCKDLINTKSDENLPTRNIKIK